MLLIRTNVLPPNFFFLNYFPPPDGDDIPGIGQYEDFHTIDWQRDIARDRMRHRYIVKKVQDSICDFLKVCAHISQSINFNGILI